MIHTETKHKNLSEVRRSLSRLTRKIFAKKITLIVTLHNEPFFEMKAIERESIGAEMTVTDFRLHTPKMLDLLEVNECVFLTEYGERRVVCKRIEND